MTNLTFLKAGLPMSLSPGVIFHSQCLTFLCFILKQYLPFICLPLNMDMPLSISLVKEMKTIYFSPMSFHLSNYEPI
jgi:hypothetical protein